MTFIDTFPETGALRQAMRRLHLADETEIVGALLDQTTLDDGARMRISRAARALVEAVRGSPASKWGIDAFLQEYALSSREGVVLMCLAEALLRIPDSETADLLIRDKLSEADWQTHLGNSASVLVNASTWGLMLTGRVVRWDDQTDLGAILRRIVGRSGEPVIRKAMQQAMRIMARQFVMGRTIEEALTRAGDSDNRQYRHSYDMLGEAAHTQVDADRYFEAYAAAIKAIGATVGARDVQDAPGISVKLSALHPRYEYAQRGRAVAELGGKLIELGRAAAAAGIGLTVDAEEAARLDLSLDVIEAVMADHVPGDWRGFGLAVQAYQKRATVVIDWLIDRARHYRRPLMIRLVKGAYWDSEIKRAQELGLDGYPVFTRKASTDVSYIACAAKLLAARDVVYPQFATHNAHTAAAVVEMAGPAGGFEFQRLHGMGEALYDHLVGGKKTVPCRVYAPVGRHEDLLPYLVRRLLENGANTSFVNRLVDADSPVDTLIADPAETVAAYPVVPHPRIPLPRHILEDDRIAARGIELDDPMALAALAADMEEAASLDHLAGPTFLPGGAKAARRPVTDPADRRRVVGHVIDADPAEVREAVGRAASAAPDWDSIGGAARAGLLETVADVMEIETASLMALAVREAGKTVGDALAEIREAVDFCRYYAGRARADFQNPAELPGPTGERNEIALHGRGVFACISPWNFPLAIFTGQIAAALAAGNTVVAKPAEQTPLIAASAVAMFHRAGIPREALQLLPGRGEIVGAGLIADPGIDGVAFTGSTETARAINRTLAGRDGPIVPLIAETGGQNAMVVDSSALTEQVVVDVIASAFQSAGQRCSALRVLFLQSDVADCTLEMLCGAMAEIRLGDPALLATDVGPVIDEEARAILAAHAERMDREARLLYAVPVGPETSHGTFFAPRVYEIDSLARLDREVFGPILHVVRYASDRLDDVLESVRNTGYGLTLGIHSRIDTTIEHIHAALPMGNVYVNRNMVGAVVGVHPFGGERLSGTGPKAGGPRYLHRFATERTLSVNTVAMGGNAALLSLADDGPA